MLHRIPARKRTVTLAVAFIVSHTLAANALTVTPTTSIVSHYDISAYPHPIFWQWNTFIGATDSFALGETLSIDILDAGNNVVLHKQITWTNATPLGGPGTTVPPGAGLGWGTDTSSEIPQIGTVLISSLSGSFEIVGNSMNFASFNDLSTYPVYDEFVQGYDVFADAAEVSGVPLPAALPLFASGLGALGLLGWRRKRKNAAAMAAA